MLLNTVWDDSGRFGTLKNFCCVYLLIVYRMHTFSFTLYLQGCI